jgi:hypothetical protein
MQANSNISPTSDGGTVYLVLEDFGRFGCAYRETDVGKADRQAIIENLRSGQYERPLKIVAFNSEEGWARDVTAEVACEIDRGICQGDEVCSALRDFIERAVPPRWEINPLSNARGNAR